MPNFDLRSLAKFLPDPKTIKDFQDLNRTVDVELPQLIDESGSTATQALTAANQALAQILDLADRVNATELLPPSIAPSAVDDLAPVSIYSASPADDLAPAHFNP